MLASLDSIDRLARDIESDGEFRLTPVALRAQDLKTIFHNNIIWMKVIRPPGVASMHELATAITCRLVQAKSQIALVKIAFHKADQAT